jgi:hypothetical protein
MAGTLMQRRGRRWALVGIAIVLVGSVVCVAGGPGTAASASPSAPQAAVAAGDDPIGNLEGPSVRLANLNYHSYDYVLYGWAADPSTPSQPLKIHIYVNGSFDREVTTGESRPDVAAVHPWAGANSGFSTYAYSQADDGGPQTVCAYAINAGAGSANTTLGCVRLPAVGSDGHEPLGSVDEVRVSPGLIHLRGWAGDRDAGNDTVEVRVYYDDTPMLSMFGDKPRPDVPGVFPQLDGTTGFDEDLPALPGHHRVCAYAGNIGKGGLGNTTLRCIEVDVPGPSPAAPRDPQGNQEHLRYQFLGTGVSSYWAVGWAFDPDTAGPWTVRVLAVNVESVFGPTDPVFVGTGTTDQPRPDVQAAFPAAGPDAGYVIELGGYHKYGGVRFACAYARQEGSGAPERFIGCSDHHSTEYV